MSVQISVIMPVYKVEKYLLESVESVLTQDYSDFELILVDDGSPDSCGKICDDLSQKDKRIMVIHKENGGLSDARNTGMRVAKGKYITYIDSDDKVDPHYLSSMYNVTVKYDADIVQVDYTKNENKIGDITKPNEVISRKLGVLENLFYLRSFKEASCGKLFSREIASRVVFPKKRLYEDVLTAYQFAYYASTFVAIHANYYYYRVNPNSIMHRKITDERFTVLSVFDEMESFFENEKQCERLSNNDLENINNWAKYYKLRTYIYIYNECVAAGAYGAQKSILDKMTKEIVSKKYDEIWMEKKYRIIRRIINTNPSLYRMLLGTIRKSNNGR